MTRPAVRSGEELKADYAALRALFMPYAVGREQALRTSDLRLAYYTNADTALRILKNEQIWMRDTRVMNDYDEVYHGSSCVRAAFEGQAAQALLRQLDAVFEGLGTKVYKSLNAFSQFITTDTYITCVSEHLNEEDEHGRLSMWRAYGGASGVALVVRADFLADDSHIGIYSSPVLYADEAGFVRKFEEVAEGILNQLAFVSQCQPEHVERHFFNALRFAILCTKHPGFAEEREWRLICCPSLQPPEYAKAEIESVRGVPQRVVKLLLKKYETIDLNIDRLLDRIIVGPTEHSVVLGKAMIELLAQAHVQYAQKRVFLSGIPLRQF